MQGSCGWWLAIARKPLSPQQCPKIAVSPAAWISAMRIVLLSNVFPSAIAPTKGTFNLELAKALAEQHEVTVVAPIAWTEEWRAWISRGLRIPRNRTSRIDGIAAYFPRFWFPPKLQRHRYDCFLRWSIDST